jgi:hypothetical protein
VRSIYLVQVGRLLVQNLVVPQWRGVLSRSDLLKDVSVLGDGRSRALALCGVHPLQRPVVRNLVQAQRLGALLVLLLLATLVVVRTRVRGRHRDLAIAREFWA